MQDTLLPSSKLPHLARWLLFLELAIVLSAAYFVASPLLNRDPLLMMGTGEFQYLTSSALTVSAAWNQYHYIPLWQPYFWMGEPLIEWGFSTVLNPFSTLPSIAYGATMGLKVSAALHVMILAVGAWVLGRVLSFGSVGRLMLAILLIGRTDIPGFFEAGFFQLAVSQAFIPYAFAGGIALLRFPNERYPIPLMGAGFALILWAGNIYYVLPTALSVTAVALVYILPRLEFTERMWKARLHVRRLVRFTLAGLFAMGLSACLLLPALLQYDYMGGHPGWTADDLVNSRMDVMGSVQQFFNPDHSNFMSTVNGAYSFVTPLWFLLLIFVLLPPIGWLHRPSFGKSWRIWAVGLFLVVFFTTWADAQNPIINWLYVNVPVFSQWRYIGRMLSAASFWVAILVAMRVDGLWRAVIVDQTWHRIKLLARPVISRYFLLTAQIGLLAAVIMAGAVSIGMWSTFGTLHLVDRNTYLSRCLTSLRAIYPTGPLSTFHLQYGEAYTYVEHRVRLTNVGTGIFPLALTPTIFTGDLADPLTNAPFALAFDGSERVGLVEQNYTMVPDSYVLPDGFHCAWARPDTLSYAFTIGRPAIEQYSGTLPSSATASVDPTLRAFDQVAFVITSQSDEETVLAVHERAYPGWQVEMDGIPAKLESVGGIIGVVIPPGYGRLHTIRFFYRPPLLILGGWITLITFGIGVLYLLRVDQWLAPRPPGSPPRRLIPRISPADLIRQIRADWQQVRTWWRSLPDDDEPPIYRPPIQVMSLPAQESAPDALPAVISPAETPSESDPEP
ncbi:MAG: hypothetical protein U0670_03420 [Anaerolineae bacterium]